VAAEEFGAGRVTVSVGAAEYPTHGETPEELIASADAAMYQAKNAGAIAWCGAGRTAERRRMGKRRRKGEATTRPTCAAFAPLVPQKRPRTGPRGFPDLME